jgi:hypothetical protein
MLGQAGRGGTDTADTTAVSRAARPRPPTYGPWTAASPEHLVLEHLPLGVQIAASGQRLPPRFIHFLSADVCPYKE